MNTPIDVTNLASKPLQDLLRDKTDLIKYMKRMAKYLNINTWGKRMDTLRSTNFVHPKYPNDYPEKCWRLLDVLEIYIECKKYWAPVQSTTQENLLFCEFKAIEKKILASK